MYAVEQRGIGSEKIINTGKKSGAAKLHLPFSDAKGIQLSEGNHRRVACAIAGMKSDGLTGNYA